MSYLFLAAVIAVLAYAIWSIKRRPKYACRKCGTLYSYPAGCRNIHCEDFKVEPLE